MANPDLAFGALQKPLKGAGKVARLDRHGVADRHAQRAARDKQLAAARELQQVRRAIYERDKGCCRVCHRVLAFAHHNPYAQMHWHHVIYRSAGGPSTVENGISLCWRCHRFEHEHRLTIVGTGDKVTITERNLTTGQILSERESAV